MCFFLVRCSCVFLVFLFVCFCEFVFEIFVFVFSVFFQSSGGLKAMVLNRERALWVGHGHEQRHNSTKRPQERGERTKFAAGGEKSAHPSNPHLSGPTENPSAPHLLLVFFLIPLFILVFVLFIVGERVQNQTSFGPSSFRFSVSCPTSFFGSVFASTPIFHPTNTHTQKTPKNTPKPPSLLPAKPKHTKTYKKHTSHTHTHQKQNPCGGIHDPRDTQVSQEVPWWVGRLEGGEGRVNRVEPLQLLYDTFRSHVGYLYSFGGSSCSLSAHRSFCISFQLRWKLQVVVRSFKFSIPPFAALMSSPLGDVQ